VLTLSSYMACTVTGKPRTASGSAAPKISWQTLSDRCAAPIQIVRPAPPGRAPDRGPSLRSRGPRGRPRRGRPPRAGLSSTASGAGAGGAASAAAAAASGSCAAASAGAPVAAGAAGGGGGGAASGAVAST